MKKNRSRAVALVVVLSVVVLLCLIIVSFSVAMRMERQAAYYFSERARADLMAKEGVEMAKMILDDTYSDTNNYIVSMPGRIAFTNIASGSGSWSNVDLASGPSATPGSGIFAPADLNRTNKTSDNLRQIDPLGGAMLLPWVYVYQDGNRTTNSSPTIYTNNPIIGRYAFWADDESTRINVNTAWKPSSDTTSPKNTNTYADPNQIALQAISSNLNAGDAYSIYTNATSRPFQGVGEVARVDANLGSVISTNRFAATFYNHSIDLNPWGEPKIYLTTQLSNLPPSIQSLTNRSDYFLDILKSNNKDPGALSAVDGTKYATQLNRLNTLLTRSNWPAFPGQSFAGKYKSGNPSRITQLSVDLIDYVRSAESASNAVSMARGSLSGSTFTFASAANGFIGTARTPMITEFGVWVSQDTTTNTTYHDNYLKAQVMVEVYLPEHYGLDSFDLTGYDILLQLNGSSVLASEPIVNVVPNPIPKGNFAVITSPIFDMREAATNSAGHYEPVGISAISPMKVRVGIKSQANEFIDIAPAAESFFYTLPPSPRPAAMDPQTLRSCEISDPRINKSGPNWVQRVTGNTFGLTNSIWKSNTVAVPKHDTDSDGKFSDYSLYMPPPKGKPGNERGLVYSVAEIGRVNTGVDAWSNSSVPPTTWRTLRFQPTAANDTTIPDWVLMDLFTVPISTNNPNLYFPATNSIAGRINPNTLIAPFDTNSKIPALNAISFGSTNLNLSNIISHQLAAGGRAFGSTNLYKFRGELAEITSVADTGEASEANLISLVNKLTVRSSVFRVYAVGQSIKQTPTGALVINATKSVETLLETQTSGTATQFRSVSWRDIPY